MRARLLVIVTIALASATTVALAAPDPPVNEPKTETSPAGPSEPVVVDSAESRVNDGQRLAAAKEWADAERAYRDAIALRRDIPEAWNGLGYALRQQGRYTESISAYEVALRLRPQYPQALEYLGEAYVKLGRLDDAREILARLRPLDAHEAEELAEAIANAAQAGSRRAQ
jgi:tetratricopeptide (TPR) repeat protein